MDKIIQQLKEYYELISWYKYVYRVRNEIYVKNKMIKNIEKLYCKINQLRQKYRYFKTIKIK